jgi:hypothetical protein
MLVLNYLIPAFRVLEGIVTNQRSIFTSAY